MINQTVFLIYDGVISKCRVFISQVGYQHKVICKKDGDTNLKANQLIRKVSFYVMDILKCSLDNIIFFVDRFLFGFKKHGLISCQLFNFNSVSLLLIIK